jgi:hypothetical protein
MDHPHFASLSRTGHVVVLLAACVLSAVAAVQRICKADLPNLPAWLQSA